MTTGASRVRCALARAPVLRQAAALALVWASGCGPPAPPPDPAEDVQPAPRCTEQGLLAFDPGSAVVRRIFLPPAVQETSNSEQHVVELLCEDQEEDEPCAERASRQARAQYPDAEVTAAVMHQRQLVRVEYELGGVPSEGVFADHAAALSHLRSLEGDGKVLRITSATTVPDPDSPRLAVARATIRGPVVQRAALRLELLLRPADGDAVAALVRAQRQAHRAGFAVHSFTPGEDGGVRMELGCTMGPGN